MNARIIIEWRQWADPDVVSPNRRPVGLWHLYQTADTLADAERIVDDLRREGHEARITRKP